MLDTRDEAHDLSVELSENNMRRNFTGSELAAGIRRQMELESAKARERMAEGGGGGNVSTPSGKARDKAGEAFGISGKQAEKVMFVDDHRDLLDPADFADWDEGKLSTNKAYQRIKAAQAQAEHERDTARAEVATVRKVGEKLKSDLDSARAEIEALESQNDELYQLANTAQVVEREVVRDVVPDDYEDIKRRVRELEGSNRLYCEDNDKLRQHLSRILADSKQPSDADRKELMKRAKCEAEAFRVRFAGINELADVFAAIDRFLAS